MPLNVQKVKWGHLLAVPAPPSARGEKGEADALFAAWILSPAAKVPVRSARPGLQAVLFDLDGVLVDTAEFHYQAWQRLADELGLAFDRKANQAFRGVGRMECLEKLLGGHGRHFAEEEKRLLAERKNGYYLELVKGLTPRDVLPGVRELISGLRQLPENGGGVRLGVVSASRNARLVVGLLHLEGLFDVIVDGAETTRSKPDPEGFLLAAERLRVAAEQCVIVEDAEAGVKAGRAAGMKAVAVGDAAGMTGLAHLCVEAVQQVSASRLEELFAMGARIPAPPAMRRSPAQRR